MGLFMPFGNVEVWPRFYALKERAKITRAIFMTVIIYVAIGLGLALIILVILGVRETQPGMVPEKAI